MTVISLVCVLQNNIMFRNTRLWSLLTAPISDTQNPEVSGFTTERADLDIKIDV